MGTLRSSCWRLLTISSVMRWQPLERVLRGWGGEGGGLRRGDAVSVERGAGRRSREVGWGGWLT